MDIVNPKTNLPMTIVGSVYRDAAGGSFPIIGGVPRFTEIDNYAENFGVQWNKFARTQLDHDSLSLSRDRLFAETNWDFASIDGQAVLEVGSGAGRFTKAFLENSRAELWSVDYSDAVSANWESNKHIAPGRFHLFQASIYDLPFSDNSFDKVFCLGVLQHTPSFSGSLKALIDKAKVGGEIVVDFYPIKGWYTKLHAKYIFRPLTKRLSHHALMSLIDKTIDFWMFLYLALTKSRLHVATRFLPICDIRGTLPKSLSKAELREWIFLDTFDMFSPEYDNPQRISDVVEMFEGHGAKVTFAGYVPYASFKAAVVRGVKL